jgi:cell division transport system permease protein
VAAVIRHALTEGQLLLRQRWLVSVGLAVALAVPIGLAGVSWSLMRWIEPVVGLAEREIVVPVLLHPSMTEEQRRQWIDEQASDHAEWSLEEVPPERLAERLTQWFPYLEDLLEDAGESILPPLVEITTDGDEGFDDLERSPAVIAIGPRSSIHRTIGDSGRRLGWALATTSALLLVAAAAFAAVWVHLELYRHEDEIKIMRLIGSTESAVRGPFLVATLVPGLSAALLAVVGTLAAVGRLSAAVTVLGLPALKVSATSILVQLVLGVGLPVAAATITLARHATADFEG